MTLYPKPIGVEFPEEKPKPKHNRYVIHAPKTVAGKYVAICGARNPIISHRWARVTCQNCLKQRPLY